MIPDPFPRFAFSSRPPATQGENLGPVGECDAESARSGRGGSETPGRSWWPREFRCPVQRMLVLGAHTELTNKAT